MKHIIKIIQNRDIWLKKLCFIDIADMKKINTLTKFMFCRMISRNLELITSSMELKHPYQPTHALQKLVYFTKIIQIPNSFASMKMDFDQTQH